MAHSFWRPALWTVCAAATASACGAALAADSRFSQDITDLPLTSLRADQFPDAVDAYAAKGDYRKALEAVDIGLKRNTRSAQLRFQRCVVLEQMGRTEDAKAELKRFIGLYPEIPEGYNNLAVLLSREGSLEEAQGYLTRALALRPKFRQAHVNLGNLYLARAKASFETAQSIKSDKAVKARLEAVTALLSPQPANER